jgi:hypothetical protein
MLYWLSMVRISKNKGEIRIPAGINVWKHELSTADALAQAGYVVEFLPTKDIKDTKSPDILMDGEKWELKAPKTDKLSAIERNLKRATKQSGNIVIDSHRLRKIHDSSVQAFLLQKFKQQKTIKKLLFVNRKHQVIDISKLI